MTLSLREMQCLRLVCQGLMPKQIGTRLGISNRTVEIHCRNIRWKLGAVNLVHAAFIAGVEGIVTNDRDIADGASLRAEPIEPVVVSASQP